MYFYVLIHALCVSVHFRAIYKCYYYYSKLIKEVSEDILCSFKADSAETTSLGAPLCLHYGESKFTLYSRLSVLFAMHLLCRHTPFKIKTLVSCIRFLLVSCVVVHLLGLRRGGGRWWWHPISFPYTSVRVFSRGVFSVLSSPVLSLCSRSSRFATLGRGGSGEFRWGSFLPVALGSHSHCQLSHPLLLFFLGGGREREYTIIYYYYAQL